MWAEVGFIFEANGALESALSDLVFVDLLEAALFTSDFLMTAIGLSSNVEFEFVPRLV